MVPVVSTVPVTTYVTEAVVETVQVPVYTATTGGCGMAAVSTTGGCGSGCAPAVVTGGCGSRSGLFGGGLFSGRLFSGFGGMFNRGCGCN